MSRNVRPPSPPWHIQSLVADRHSRLDFHPSTNVQARLAGIVEVIE